MQESDHNEFHGVKREPTSVETLASKRPCNPVYMDPTLASSPLLQAVLVDDVQGVRAALEKKSDYDYVYSEIKYEGFKKSFNALDIAIVRGCFHNVQLIVDLNFDITCQYSTLSGRGRSNNPFVLAATYYKKEIFDYLIKKFNDQLTHSFIVLIPNNRTPNLFCLRGALNTIIETVERLPLEAIDLLLKQGIDPFGESSLEVLFNIREFPEDASFSAYIQKFGPDLCMNACIRDRRVADLKQLKDLGHKMMIKDRSGHTPYQAMSDKQKDHTLPWVSAFELSVKTNKKREERFVPWNKRTQQLFDIILENQILPCYEDFIYAARQNGEVLNILLNWELKALNPRLTIPQYVEVFNVMLACQGFHSVQQEIFNLLSEKYVDFYKQIDKDLNNVLHIVATVDKKLKPTLFLNFFEKYLRNKYPLKANDILGDLMSAKNKEEKFPDECNIKSDAVRKKLENWKAYRSVTVAVPVQSSYPKGFLQTSFFVDFLDPCTEVIRAMRSGNIRLFSTQIARISAEKFADPEVGYTLLVNAITSGELQFITILLNNGCDVFLKSDNPYARALFVLATNVEIFNALKARSEKINAVHKQREVTQVLEK